MCRPMSQDGDKIYVWIMRRQIISPLGMTEFGEPLRASLDFIEY